MRHHVVHEANTEVLPQTTQAGLMQHLTSQECQAPGSPQFIPLLKILRSS